MSPRDPRVSPAPASAPSIGVTRMPGFLCGFLGPEHCPCACTLSAFPVPFPALVPVALLRNVLETRFWLPGELLLLAFYFGPTSCPGVLSALVSSLTVIFSLIGLIVPTISSEFWKSVSSASSTPLIFFFPSQPWLCSLLPLLQIPVS